MDLMVRRRQLMGMQKEELYPIGTNLYDGVVFQTGKIDSNTGELVEDSTLVASDYLLVSTDYEYTRSYRLYGVYNYDENKNYLGAQGGFNNLSTSVINPFEQGTKYIRTTVHGNYRNAQTGLIAMDNCWLKRTK